MDGSVVTQVMGEKSGLVHGRLEVRRDITMAADPDAQAGSAGVGDAGHAIAP